MHAPAELVLEVSKLGSHALADRRAPHGESPEPVLPTNMFEAQEIERLGFPFSFMFPVLFGKSPELDPARTLAILLGNGKGGFRPASFIPVEKTPLIVVAGDFNNDKKLDLAVSNNGKGAVSELLGKGDGTFQAPRLFQVRGAASLNVPTSMGTATKTSQ